MGELAASGDARFLSVPGAYWRRDRGEISASYPTAWVYDQLAGAIDGCNRESFGFDLRDFDEDLAIVDYREGDFYEWHLDIGREAPSRKLSVSVMLSSPEDYDGGGLISPSRAPSSIGCPEAALWCSRASCCTAFNP